MADFFLWFVFNGAELKQVPGGENDTGRQRHMRRLPNRVVADFFTIVLCALPAVSAAAHQAVDFEIPPSNAATALSLFAQQADVALLYPYFTAKARQVGGLKGRYTVDEGIRLLLFDTCLTAIASDDRGIPRDANNENKGIAIVKTSSCAQVSAPKSFAIAILSMFGIGHGYAQEPTAQAHAKMEEIVVSARKRDEALTDVPVTVNVVGEQELFEKRLNSLENLTKTIPNVQLSSDMVTRARISIRGVGPDITGNTGPGVGLYIDGLYQPTTAALNLPFFDLERVEVLKGPQGTLYGRNSLGGVINYITAKPGNEFKASAQVDAANMGTYRTAASIGGAIIEDRLFFRLSAQYGESDGPWQYEASGDDVAPSQFTAARGRLVLKATDRLEFDLSLSSNDLEGGALPYTSITDVGHLKENFVTNPPNKATTEDQTANLVITYDFDAFELVSRNSYTDLDTWQNPDSDYSSAPILHALSVGNRKVIDEEIRLQSTGNEDFQWMVGVAYSDEDLDTDVDVFLDATRASVFGAQTNTSQQVASAFTDVTYNVTDRLEIGAGVRFDKIESTIKTQTGLSQDYEEDVWQPKLTARYKISDDLTGFVSAAKGFRQGGFNVASQGTPDATFSGDTLWNYETGLKWQTPGGEASGSISLFYIDWQDITGGKILQAAGGVPIVGTGNFGAASVYGFEVEGALQLNPFLTLSGSSGVLDCEYKDVNGATAGIENGGTCQDSSKWTGRLSLDFDYPLSDSDLALTGGANVTGQGDTRVGTDIQDRDERQVQDAYYLLGASVGLKNRQWQVILYADNLLDEEYATLVRMRETIGTALDVAVLGQPRTYGLRVRFDY